MYDPEAFVTSKAQAAVDFAGESGSGPCGSLPPNQGLLMPVLEGMSWRSGESILDYGCGPGTMTLKTLVPYAEKYDAHIVGVDTSAEMVDYARKNSGHARVQYVHADLCAQNSGVGLVEGSFDKLICCMVLHYLKPHKEALVRLCRFLKPGGQLGFVNFSRSVHYNLLQELATDPKWAPFMEAVGGGSYVPEWTEKGFDFEDDLRASLEAEDGFLKRAGLRVVSMQSRVNRYEPQLDNLATMMYSTGPLTAFHSDPAKQAQLKKELIEWYRKALRRHYAVGENGSLKGYSGYSTYGVLQKE